MSSERLRINPKRLREDFEALSAIGATADGGVDRPAFSPVHLEARGWFRERIAEAGLDFRTDGAGNHSAVLACGSRRGRSLILGSHLDSVPRGGRFDGALGVLAALEVLRSVKDAGRSLAADLEAMDFSDEEGTLVGLLGSEALTGRLTREALQSPRGGREALEAGLARAGLDDDDLLSARRDPATLAGYLELHIEQGPRLVEAKADLGIVSGIVGIRSYRLTFHGRANHAGTTPMDRRQDGALGASAFVLAARGLVLDEFPDGVANVGQMTLRPGAFNIVPGSAEAGLEFRALEPARLDALERALLARAEAEAARFGLTLTAEPRGGCAPSPMDERVRTAIGRAADSLGLSHVELPSYAGHDAQSMARVCPAGMIFSAHKGRGYTFPPTTSDQPPAANHPTTEPPYPETPPHDGDRYPRPRPGADQLLPRRRSGVQEGGRD